MKIYAGAAMRGQPMFNFQMMEDSAIYLRSLGNVVVSPHEIDMDEGLVSVQGFREIPLNPTMNDDGRILFHSVELTPKFSMEAALRRDISAITSCDAVSFLEGWEDSEGCQIEDQVRAWLGMSRYVHGRRADGVWFFRKDGE